ncbi:MAG: RseA family anti-sigma factor [Burkholderiales bacterium]
MNEELSLLMDSEIEANEVAPLLHLLNSNADARDQWTVIQMIGDATRGLVVADDGFSIRIFEKLENIQIDALYDPLAGSPNSD